MGTPLTSQTPGTPDFTYKGLLNFEGDDDGITAALRNVCDGLGNNTGIQLSTTTCKYTGIFVFNSLTATTVPYLNASKELVSSAVTPTELGYLSGVSSAIQAQLNALDLATNIHAATTKTPMVAADEIGFWDSVSGLLRKLTFTNLLTSIAQFIGPAIAAITSKSTPVDSDKFLMSDSAASDASIKLTWANLKATLITTWQDKSGKFAGLTLFKINFRNAADTFTSFFTNSNTAARTYTFPDTDLTVIGRDDTAVITNKDIKPRVSATASASTLVPERSTYDLFVFTAPAANLAINNHATSSPSDGQQIKIRIIPTGTYTLSFDTNYVARAGVALPTGLTSGKVLTLMFEWCSSLSKYNLMAAGLET